MQASQKNSRIFNFEASHKTLRTPFFFPAISTIKTNFSVTDYFDLLTKIRYPGFLISSYDLFNNKNGTQLLKKLSAVTQGDIVTLMDSGNYEAYWNTDTKWNINKYQQIIKKANTDLCFSFDVFWSEGKNVSKHIKEIIKATAESASQQSYGDVIPIIHSTPNNVKAIVRGVLKGLSPKIIGIPERELGASLFDRAATIREIRQEMENTGYHIPLHILGTGNPASLLVYSLCGADLYDGLEWCTTVANPHNGHLHHFVQRDLFECECEACKSNMPYHIKTITHNLIFYKNFMNEISAKISQGEVDVLLKKYLPKHTHTKIKSIAGLK